jgi:crotonobetainyl-CoA:carnitine CoA-transferase CaiB-like acyl-CoA transferase
MRSREFVSEHVHPRLGRFETFGRSITFSETQAPNWAPPPLCGQHTREILAEYGYEASDIDKLIEAKAIFEELWVD